MTMMGLLWQLLIILHSLLYTNIFWRAQHT